MIYAALERSINQTYSDQLTAQGSVPKGVFWRNKSTQIARFDALLSTVSKITPVARPTLADIGCGYGAMFEFIQQTPRYRSVKYSGFDINQKMIIACKNKFPKQKQLFGVGKYPSSTVDFCLFSGTFNLCHTANTNLWEDYIFANLQQCWKRSRYGLALNLLCTSRSSVNNQIFYAEQQKFINRASMTFGPTHTCSTPHVAGDVTFAIIKP